MSKETPEEISTIYEEVETIVPDVFCEICHKQIDVHTEPYTLKKSGGKFNAWHYMCYEREATEVITMSHKTKMLLATHLISLREQGKTDAWIQKVINSCGYR